MGDDTKGHIGSAWGARKGNIRKVLMVPYSDLTYGTVTVLLM